MNKHLLIYAVLVVVTLNKCAYRVDGDGKPFTPEDPQPFIVQGMNQCLQYNGKLGCCDENNDGTQKGSYVEIDSIFGFGGGGCDHCSINLKRFWCEYACSPNQSNFINVTQEHAMVPDPQHPGQQIQVQKVTLTVQAQTACDLYNSCKRNSFVASVSAMTSPAGFLTFQGHNAVNQGFQYIQAKFLFDKDNSLVLSDQFEQPQRKALSSCNTIVNGSEWHQFKYNQNCKCNTCEQSCDNNSGFIYAESSVFEGFNWILVGGTYLLFGIIAALVTLKRNRDQKKKDI